MKGFVSVMIIQCDCELRDSSFTGIHSLEKKVFSEAGPNCPMCLSGGGKICELTSRKLVSAT